MDGPRVWTIPPAVPFADALADGLWARAGGDPEKLREGIVLVPHRRAVRVVADAFLRRGAGRAALLPAIRALGDVDEDEPFAEPAFALEAEADGADGAGAACPPAIPETRRALLLARLVMAWPADPAGDGAGAGSEAAPPEQAIRLAGDLARLLDRMQTAGASFEALAGLVPEEHAEHWRRTLDFLRIAAEHWPRVLEEEGAVDPAVRRDRMLDGLAERWRAAPPAGPVTVAGSTGSVPATARLMRVVAGLPRGAIVLPGLDRGMDAESWRAAGGDPAHPQHALARLLDALDVRREAVADWTPAPAGSGARQRLLSEAMRPAATTDRWRGLAARGIDTSGLGRFVRVDCADPNEEAGVIALLLRETLEEPGKTAALVTPDRGLARRVKAELRRWGIEIDDSAGLPLADTPAMAFWRLTGAAAAEGLAPVPLLAALKHPLARGGMAAGAFRRRVRRLERAVLRGPRPAPGIDGLRAALDAMAGAAADDASAAEAQSLRAWLEPFVPAFRAFEAALDGPPAPPRDLLRAHNRLAEALAAGEDGDGAARLWSGEAGERAAAFLAELHEAAGDWPPLEGRHYGPALEALLDGAAFRPRHGGHPRLAILGPLEARLQSPDRAILGGLNEGVWPPEPAADPWLSRPMAAALGLPAPEARIGQSAHDFVQACGAREAFLTRSRRVEGTPAVESRWLRRLSAVLEALGAGDALGDPGADWRGWRARLVAPERDARRPPPEPRPPVAARSRRLSVTQVGVWRRNPYAIYARRVLDLRPLDPLDAEPDAADRGIFVHRALDRFLREGPPADDATAPVRLLEIGREALGPAGERPAVAAFWWPRFERIARWFLEKEAERAGDVARTLTEAHGEISFDGPAGPFALTAIADRLDALKDGSWAIIDYKTGTVPAARDVAAGLEPQLPLEALILREGGFAGAPAGSRAALAYWRLSGGDPAGEVRRIAEDPDALAGAAEAGLARLVAAFDDPRTPYLAIPDPAAAPRYDDYAHLARVKEWAR